MISIKQAVSLLDIEDMYGMAPTPKGSVIRVPSALRYGGTFGVPASLLQFLATWSRNQSNASLKLYPSTDTDSALQNLTQEPHGMAALYFAPNIVDSSEATVSTREGLVHAIPQIQAMQASNYQETMHGRGVFLGCFGGAKNEYLHPLYSRGRPDSLRGRDDFETLTSQIINACAPSARSALSIRNLSAISNLIYELFRNTDEHARTDEKGKAYARNMRGIMAKFISINPRTAKEEANVREAPHAMFMLRNLANQKLRIDENGKQRSAPTKTFLELTVFDTGPGLASRWLSKNGEQDSIDKLAIEEELHLVRTCFERHSTTKDSGTSGHGLDLVVNVLSDLSAFLRLRTGRVCLYQDFSSINVKKFDPRHWEKNLPEMAHVAGATYSIIIPLSRAR